MSLRQILAARANVRTSLLKDPPQVPDESVLRLVAHDYWDDGRISECIAAVGLLEQRQAVTFRELHFRGYWELYLGDSEAARETFQRALKQNRRDHASRLGLAYSMFYLQDFKSAASLFQELADENTPLHSPPIMAAASKAMAAGRQPLEIQMAPLSGLPPDVGDIMQMRLLYGVSAAINEARKRVLQRPRGLRLPLQRLLAELYLDANQNQQALDLIDEAAAMYGPDGQLMLVKGMALRRLERREESRAAFALAVESAPLEPRAWGALAAGYLESKQLTEAIRNYRIAIFLDDTNANFWGDLGIAESELKNYAAAEVAISKSIDLGLINFANYFNRGFCRIHLGDLEGANRDLQSAIWAEPNNPRIEDALDLVARLGGGPPDTRFVFGETS